MKRHPRSLLLASLLVVSVSGSPVLGQPYQGREGLATSPLGDAPGESAIAPMTADEEEYPPGTELQADTLLPAGTQLPGGAILPGARTQKPTGTRSGVGTSTPAPIVELDLSAPAPVVEPDLSTPAPVTESDVVAPAPVVEPEEIAPAPVVEPDEIVGVPYISGGIGVSGREEMQSVKDRFNLRLLFAVKGTGAYLANVKVRIDDAAGPTLLNAVSQGPWLYVSLVPGRYVVTVDNAGQVQRAEISVPESGAVGQSFYWTD